MAEEIRIDISPSGEIQIEGIGIQGADCVKLTEALETALGTVEKRIKKPEYHAAKNVLRKVGA